MAVKDVFKKGKNKVSKKNKSKVSEKKEEKKTVKDVDVKKPSGNKRLERIKRFRN